MNDPFQQAEKQALRYWYVDGLSEIAAGLILLVIALYYLLLAWLPLDASAGWLATVGQLVVLAVLVVLARLVVQALKERITYPRTGYIALRHGGLPRRAIVAALAVMFAAVFALAVGLSKNAFVRHWLVPPFPALFVAFMGYTYGLRRFYLMAIYTLLISIASTFLGLGSIFDSAAFLAAFGMGWVVTGAFGLARYLRSTRPVGLEGGE